MYIIYIVGDKIIKKQKIKIIKKQESAVNETWTLWGLVIVSNHSWIVMHEALLCC